MKYSLGTDHFVHLRIIKNLKAKKEYFLEDVFTLNEKYCFYPFLFHWLISKLPTSFLENKSHKKIIHGIKILRVLFFNFFIFQFNFVDDTVSFILLNTVYLTFPFSYFKWNAINRGLSARGFGLLIGEIYLYIIFIYLSYDHYLTYLIVCVFGVIFYLGSQFGSQFFILSSLFITIFKLDLKFVLIPVLSLTLYSFFFKKVAKSYFYGQINHKRNYLLFFLKTQFKHRKSFYRDFIYDFWIKFKRKPKQGIKYFLTNPFIEISYGFHYLTVLFILSQASFQDISNLELIVFSGLFCFVFTTFRITRFLGEAQRYIQFTLPFISIIFVHTLSISIILSTIFIGLIIIVTYNYINTFKNNKIDAVSFFYKVKNHLKKDYLIISNDTQLLKVFSAYFQIVSTDWTYYFKNKEEFNFYHPNNYMTISPEAIIHFNKKHSPSILIINNDLYDETEKSLLKNNFTLKKITELGSFNLYKIMN